MKILYPATIDELQDAVADAARTGAKLEIIGGGSKVDIGAPRETDLLDMTGFSGIIDYDPAELVLTVGAGTPIAEIEALVASRNQMLAFEPFDWGPMLKRFGRATTIGGVVAAGVSGPRRVSRGAVRDHLLGFKAVSGRGEAFVGGAKVVKNVTGYDLPKLAAGSWGRLFAMAEVTLKVLPAPEVVETLYLAGLKPAEAVAVMAAALGSQADVAAAAHLPGGGGFTLLRLEGFGPSVAARREMLKVVTADFGPLIPMTEDEAKACWVAFRDSGELLGEVLWRINLPPSASSAVIAALEMLDARWLMDWAGGLIWLTLDGNAGAVRAAAQAAGGHAMLVRAPEAMRREVPALHPQASGVMALEARVRRAFDPEGVFETGRFLDQTDAD